MIIWDDSMSTGVLRLDEQHKMLFQKFNELSKVLSKVAARQAAREAAGELLDFLQFYAEWHFNQEEDCMDSYKCPAAAANKHAHAQFIEQFGRFYTQWQENTMTMKLVMDTYLELEVWLVNHIAKTDSRLRTCLK